MQGIIGKKLGMSHVFGDDGKAKAVTAIEVGPCLVTQVKTVAKEGYNALQLGFGKAKSRQKEQFKHLREFRVADTKKVKVGDKVDASLFKAGDLVDIAGIAKGKGFAGVIKRHHFAGGPKTHGQSDRHRAPGSIGATTSPGRVFKGTRMAGHMGNSRVMARHLEVIEADPARNRLLVKGAVPGARNGLLLVMKSGGK
ncbi:MAG: 50S ribosomal protein L3 [Dehalococcoidia bacterium]|nr:MAG: 50S ribosomal protein L3 [Dehalococcoidia bacterium]